MSRTWSMLTREQKDAINATRKRRRATRKRLGLKRPSRRLTPAQRQRANQLHRQSRARGRPARAAAAAARKAARDAAKAERLRLYPWLRKVKKADRVHCPNCWETHGGTNGARDCAHALGRALGQETQAKNKAAKAAWVCPPCPMPQEKSDVD